jgi:hypothetical protein
MSDILGLSVTRKSFQCLRKIAKCLSVNQSLLYLIISMLRGTRFTKRSMFPTPLCVLRFVSAWRRARNTIVPVFSKIEPNYILQVAERQIKGDYHTMMVGKSKDDLYQHQDISFPYFSGSHYPKNNTSTLALAIPSGVSARLASPKKCRRLIYFEHI